MKKPTMKEKNGRSTSHAMSLRSTFARRGKGLLKKAYELSTLVGVDVCVILLPPSGEGGSSSSSLPLAPLTWPEQPSDLLRIIDRFQSVGHGKRRNHQSSSSASPSPSPLLKWPEEPSDLLSIIHRFQSVRGQNLHDSSPAPSFLLKENHSLKQELQQVGHQNLEPVAPSLPCDAIGTRDVQPLLGLDPTISEMQRITEEKEFLEFLESLPQVDGEKKPTATHLGNQVVDIGQPLLLDDLPPSPMTWSSSALWDFPILQESPLHCSSQFQSSILEDEISFFCAAFGDSNASPIF